MAAVFFQTLLFRAHEILDSLKSNEAKAEFVRSRDLWFATFRQRFAGRLDSEFTKAVTDEHSDMSVHEHRKTLSRIKEAKQLEPLFNAYRELRIEHQIGFVNYKLKDDSRPFSGEARSQANTLSVVGLLSIFGLCVVHMTAVGLVLFAPSDWEKYAVILSCVAIWCALLALAARAIEQGLQLEREVERYQQYRSMLKIIRGRFDDADDATGELQIMYEMEQLSYEEMRNFLQINDKARFIM